MRSKEDSHDNALAEALKLLVQGRAHPLVRNLGRTSTPPVVATAEWVYWCGHYPAPFRYRYAHPRRARSRLGARHPPPGTITTGNHRHQINQPPQNPGLDKTSSWLLPQSGVAFTWATNDELPQTKQPEAVASSREG